MKIYCIAFFVLLAALSAVPVQAQFFKKLKDEASQRMKDKLEQKKAQKMDEQTEKASNKIMSVPDTVVHRTGRAIRTKKEKKAADSTANKPVIEGDIPKPAEDSSAVKQ